MSVLEDQGKWIPFTSPSDNTMPLFFYLPSIRIQDKCNNSMDLSPLKWGLGGIRWIMRIGSIWEVIIMPTFCASIQKLKSGMTWVNLGEKGSPLFAALQRHPMGR